MNPPIALNVERKFGTYLSGRSGEFLVAAELCRRGIAATVVAGAMPEIDIIAYYKPKSIPIQVKTVRRGGCSINLKHYLNIDLDGSRQLIRGRNDRLDRDLAFVFVRLGMRIGDDEFYIMKQGDMQEEIYRHHSEYLRRFDGVRPRSPASMHASFDFWKVEGSRDNWRLIERDLGVSHT